MINHCSQGEVPQYAQELAAPCTVLVARPPSSCILHTKFNDQPNYVTCQLILCTEHLLLKEVTARKLS